MFEGYNEFMMNIVIPYMDMYDDNRINLAQFKATIDSAVRKMFPWFVIPE